MPDYTIAQIMTNMPKVFHPEKAEGLNADIQFNFDGQEPGNWVLSIKDGQASVTEGTTAEPTATVDTSSETWKGITTGQTNAMTAFMTGKLKATGDMGLLMRMQNLFG